MITGGDASLSGFGKYTDAAIIDDPGSDTAEDTSMRRSMACTERSDIVFKACSSREFVS
jgi:hypothetical protein